MPAWVERQRSILDFALGALRRRPGKNLGLVAVFTAVVALLASVMFFLSSLRREAMTILAGSPEILVQKMVAGRHDLIPVAYAERLAGLRGVASARPRLWGYWFDPVTRANYTLLVPPEDAPAPGTIVIGEGISRTRGAFPGDILSLATSAGESHPLAIAGTLPGETELVSADLVLLGAEDFRALFGVPEGLATDIAVRVPNGLEVETLAAKIARLMPDARIVQKGELRRTYEAVFDWRGGMILVLVSGAGLAFVIFSWDRAAGLSGEERREIGILKAVGWETSDVLLLKLWEGAAVALTSFLAGLTLAYVHVFVLGGFLISSVLKGWSVLYPEFRLLPAISPLEVGTLFFLTVVPFTAASLLPAWRAATIDPDAVMRS